MPYQVTEKCTHCGNCRDACPLEAILEGEDRPRIDPDLCADCGACADLCPDRAIVGA